MTEVWQLYGIDGELLSEYAASAGAASPQKEYGYRNGQLLITADAPLTTSVNVALASNGATATASSSYSGFAASGAINGDRKGLGAWQDGYWSTATAGFPTWLEVDFSGSKTISEIDVFTGQDNYSGPVEPTMATTFTIYGLSGYDVQYWNGSSWVTVSGGGITGNNKIWRKLSFAAITTSKIRVLTNASPDNYSRLTEVEAWTTASPPPPPPPRVNVALASAGATASSSSSYSSSYGPATTNDGDRGGGWNDAAPANTFPDWVQIDFSGSKTIDEIDVFTLQDNWGSPIEPTETMTFTLWGLSGYDVQYWNGTAWVTVTNGSISGNNKIWRKLTFSPITTSKIRVLTDASMDGYSRITEVEAWTPVVASGTSTNINWLVTDQLGTPRMIFDKTGSLATTKRHDYLPFGEELFATQGARTSSIGYGAADGVRQKFTSKERDNETGLDYFLARYYSSTQGRFTSADPIFLMIQKVYDPQQWNMYGYARSNPLRFVDPSGKYICSDNGKCESDDDKAFEAARQKDLHSSDKKVRQAAKAYGDPTVDNKVYVGFGAKQSTEGGEVNFGVGKDGKYDGTLHVTFSRGQMTTGGDPTALGAVVAHEGQHVRDDQNMRDRGYDPKYVITHREAERRAYGVEERYLEAETEKRNPKTGEWEHKFNPDWISTKAIDNYLDNDPKYHNLDSPIIDTSKVPRQKVPQAKPPK